MKIKFNQPTLNSKQIAEKKDFALLMEKVKTNPPKSFYKSGWFITSLFTLGIILSVYLIIENAPEKDTVAKTTTKKAETITYEEDSKCVNPPSQKLEIPAKRFVIDPSIEQKIALKNAEIEIPKLAFKDSKNNVITDSIELKFSVYNDAIDFVVSGIPMEYDSAGTVYTFESGGMFKLEGFDLNHNPILISKPLNITFTTKEVQDFNFYNLDTIAHNWNYISSNHIKTKEVEGKTITTDVKPTTFNETKRQLNIANQEWIRAKNNLLKQTKFEPIAPSKVSQIDKTFVLDIDKYEFPELSFFYKIKFEPVDLTAVENSIYTQNWDSKRIRQYKKYYQLILKNKNTSKIVIVKPVYDGEELDIMTNSYLKKLERYNNILKEKKEIELQKRTVLEEKKKNIDPSEGEPSAKKTAKSIGKSIGKSIIVGLSAPIVFFGTFNFDKVVLPRINKEDETTPLNIEKIEKPKFLSLNGLSVHFEKIYVIESKRNASFSFDLTKRNELTYNIDSKISIIGFNENEELFLVDKKQFKKALENQENFVGAFIPDVNLSVLKRRVLGI